MSEARLPRLLLVDDDATFRRLISGNLAHDGFDVVTAANGIEALDRLSRRAFDLALIDLRMPTMDGVTLLAEMQRRHPAVIPIVLTGYGSVESAVASMRYGAVDVLSKTTPVGEVVDVLRRVLATKTKSRGTEELEHASQRREAFYGMTGRSEAMLGVFRTIERLWDDDQAVLVYGESGTGKELVARALHDGGKRRAGPFIAINCASLKENFIESELFGYVRGAFTGANANKRGLFDLADNGTLLIDEVGEMTESAQASLLRVIETKTFRPIGATKEHAANVRVVAATNRDLESAIADGRFRADLYYRLLVGSIWLPPLRERREDIPLLINHFLDTSANARRLGAQIPKETLEQLIRHDWPGNVRELLNTLERAVLMAEGPCIEPDLIGLPGHVCASRDGSPVEMDEDLTLAELEREYIQGLMRREGNVTRVARILDVDPTTIRRKLHRWKKARCAS